MYLCIGEAQSEASFAPPLVALAMSGRAHTPTLNTNPKVTYRNSIPDRRPYRSPSQPITKGTSAPPMIPEHKIPANGPWCWGTEFKPSDTRVGHMIEAKNPMQGKATRDASAEPNRANDSMHSAPSENPISTRRLSKSFSKPIPSRQPA